MNITYIDRNHNICYSYVLIHGQLTNTYLPPLSYGLLQSVEVLIDTRQTLHIANAIACVREMGKVSYSYTRLSTDTIHGPETGIDAAESREDINRGWTNDKRYCISHK